MGAKGLTHPVLTLVLTKRTFAHPVSTAVSTTEKFSRFLSPSKKQKSRRTGLQKT